MTDRELIAVLDDASVRLDRVLRDHAQAGALAFDVGRPASELVLLEALASIGRAGAGTPVSFSRSESPEQSEAADQALLARLLEQISTIAKIETQASGRLVVSTKVGLAGDLTTTIGPSASPTDLALHSKLVDQTLRVRYARIRLLIATVQTAAKIAVAVGTGNLHSALLAAWRFIHAVVEESAPVRA